MGDKLVTEEDIAKIIYDTDIYEQVTTITNDDSYDTHHLIWLITTNINSNYSSFLNQFDIPSLERDEFLTDHIKRELSYFLRKR